MTPSHHIIVGAGAMGRATAKSLIAAGQQVTVVSRSGTDLGIAGVTAVPLDAANAADLAAAAAGATSIINAANPAKYHQWESDWPPVAAAMLQAAERSGAGLVTVSNLYGYGEVTSPMTERTPLRPTGPKGRVRVSMWSEALEAHEQGRVRATELRASDYFGPDKTLAVSLLNQFVITPAIAGKKVRLISGHGAVEHSWTYAPDVGSLAAVLACDDRSWGRAWHVPTSDPRTIQEVADDVNRLCGGGVRRSEVVPMPSLVKKLARLSPTVRELDETAHQFERPFILDSSLTQSTFGLEPTPWEQALGATIASLR